MKSYLRFATRQLFTSNPFASQAFALFVGVAMMLMVTHTVSAQNCRLIGKGKLPGTNNDQSGLTDRMSDGTPHNLFGGISGLEYLADQNAFLAVSDRGPKDGAVNWHCRFHTLRMNISDEKVVLSVESSALFTDAQNRRFTGHSTAYAATENFAERFDPEAIRSLPNGNVLVSDEYGPHVVEFTPEGEEVRRIPVPSKLLVRNLGSNYSVENVKNSSGRACNRGMEGIAISPNGRFLLGLMQSSLLQDSRRTTEGYPVGKNVRLVKLGLQQGAYKEFVYVMESESHKLHEILTINENEFLVIENDGEMGDSAKHKKIYRVNICDATDVSQVNHLPSNDLPKEITPVRKSLLLDMQDPQFGMTNTLPKKIEGLAWGPSINEKQTLIVASDNDFDPTVESEFFVFEVDLSESKGVNSKLSQSVDTPTETLNGVTKLENERKRRFSLGANELRVKLTQP